MKRKKILTLLSILIFSASFLGFAQRDVEALPCNPGNYTEYDSAQKAGEKKFKCSSVAGNKNKLTSENIGTDSKMGANGMDNPGSNGPAWVNKFSKFILSLAVMVAYFSEAVAMLTIAYASYLYTTSEGDTKKMKQSKMLIMYAFVGMFIGAFSLVISKMIGGAF